jgi:flagellin-like protein
MNNKGVSAIVGFVLMILITLAISVTVYVYIDSFIHQTQKQQDFLTKCFNESNWNLPKNTTIDFSRYSYFTEHRDGWYSVDVTLEGKYPFEDKKVTAWFNINTKETYILK